MRRFLLSVGVAAVAVLAPPNSATAGEGWCGGTDTTQCCEDLGLGKGACSCVCIPGNCYCGPRLTSEPPTQGLGPDAAVTVIELEDGRVVKRQRTTKRALMRMERGPRMRAMEPATGRAMRPAEEPPAAKKPPKERLPRRAQARPPGLPPIPGGALRAPDRGGQRYTCSSSIDMCNCVGAFDCIQLSDSGKCKEGTLKCNDNGCECEWKP